MTNKFLEDIMVFINDWNNMIIIWLIFLVSLTYLCVLFDVINVECVYKAVSGAAVFILIMQKLVEFLRENKQEQT